MRLLCGGGLSHWKSLPPFYNFGEGVGMRCSPLPSILRVRLRPPQGEKSPSSNVQSCSRSQGEITFSLVSFWVGSCFWYHQIWQNLEARDLVYQPREKKPGRLASVFFSLSLEKLKEILWFKHDVTQFPNLKTESWSQVPAHCELYFLLAVCLLHFLMRITYNLKAHSKDTFSQVKN